MEEGLKKEGYMVVIVVYMKLVYKIWNCEYYVSDEIIKVDLCVLFKG